MENDRDYYLRREASERRLAALADDHKVRSVHAELADQYRLRMNMGSGSISMMSDRRQR
jgi:hypothetical protein